MFNKTLAIFFLLLLLLPVFCISQKDDSLVPYRKGNKWGIVTTKKKVVIEPVYESIFTQNSWVKIYANNKYGLFTTKGELICGPEFDKIEILFDDSAGTIICCRKKGEEKLVDGKGITLFPFSQTKYSVLTGTDKIKTISNEMTGMIDRKCKVLIKPEWKYLALQTKYIFATSFNAAEPTTLFLTNGEQMPFKGNFTQETKKHFFIYRKGDLLGLAGPDGKELTPARFQVLLELEQNPGFFMYRNLKKDAGGIINSDGKSLLPDSSYFTEFVGKDKVWVNKKGKFILYSTSTGKKILKNKYDEVQHFISGHKKYYKIRRKKKWGLLNENGEILFGERYDQIISYANKICIAQFDKEIFIINGSDMFPVKNKYDQFCPPADGIICVVKYDSIGFIDYEGKEVIKLQYNRYRYYETMHYGSRYFPSFYKGRASVLKGDTALLIDKNNKEISRLQPEEIKDDLYLSIDTNTNNFALFSLDKNAVKIFYENGKAGMKNREGQILIPPQFDKIKRLDKNYYLVYQKGKIAFMDSKLNIVSKFIYDDVALHEFYYTAYINNKECNLGKDLTLFYED
ncbi:MAG: WG repeat-containing protein [Bacteroidia bacterium]|nr:WG repeat-containing protein [Bacteroidia bacterium]